MSKRLLILAAVFCSTAAFANDYTGRLEERPAYRVNGVTVADHSVWWYGRTGSFEPVPNADGVVELRVLTADGRSVTAASIGPNGGVSGASDHRGFPAAAGPGVDRTGVHSGASGTPLLRVGFPRGSSALTPDAKEALREVAQRLRAGDASLSVQAFTDSLGSHELNQELAVRRANRVVDFLIEQGISRSRMAQEAKPRCCYVAANDSPEGRARNRRVDVFQDQGE